MKSKLIFVLHNAATIYVDNTCEEFFLGNLNFVKYYLLSFEPLRCSYRGCIEHIHTKFVDKTEFRSSRSLMFWLSNFHDHSS